MKKLFLCLAFFSIHLALFSQKVYFIYLQSEPQQAFYLKMNGKVYTASTSGYLIISKLIDSSYAFRIGFPGNKSPEQSFTVAMNKKDHGYLLKDFGEKGWGLFDLQTMAVQHGGGSAMISDPGKIENKDVSAFTNILSQVAEDPDLKDKSVRPVEEKKPVEVVKIDPPKVEEKNPVEIVKTEPIKVEEKKPVEVVKIDPPVKEEKKPVTAVVELPKKEEPKTEIKEEIVKTTEPVVIETINKEEPVTEIKEKPADADFKRSVITRKGESSTTEGFGLVFTDDNGEGKVDTIRLIIPDIKPVVTPVKEEPKEEKKFLEIVPADTVKIAETKEVIAEVKVPVVETKAPVIETKKTEPVINDPVKVVDSIIVEEKKPLPTGQIVEAVVSKNCAAMASQDDFFKLRKNMASVPFDDDMINVARKIFKTKCFTTLQIKNLGHLFLDDEGKYKFYDVAYSYVSDPANFISLVSELKDKYYITRFNAMLR